MDLCERRTAGRGSEIPQQKQVDDVAGAIVDDVRRIMRI